MRAEIVSPSVFPVIAYRVVGRAPFLNLLRDSDTGKTFAGELVPTELIADFELGQGFSRELQYHCSMDSDTPPGTTVDSSTAEKSGSSTAINALIGAAAGVILSFVPFSTLLGGAIAGYLESGDGRDGVRVGAIAGVIMLIPMTLMGMFFMFFFLGFGNPGAPIAFGIMAIFMLLISALYTVGLSAVGGYLGIYLKHEL